jgi:hypothetical protein
LEKHGEFEVCQNGARHVRALRFGVQKHVVASFDYNEHGDLTSTTDANDFTRTFLVNEYGDVTGTSFAWSDPIENDGIGLDPATVSTSAISTTASR